MNKPTGTLAVGLIFSVISISFAVSGPKAEQALKQLKAQDVVARRQAAETLGQLRDPSTAPALLQALKDKDAYVRVLAVRDLGTLRDRAAAGPLSEVLAKDPSDQVRSAATVALRMIGDPAGIQALGKALSDPSVDVRMAAINALTGFQGPEAVAAVTQATQDASPVVQKRAAMALEQMTPKEDKK